jgi:hypothetical protein
MDSDSHGDVLMRRKVQNAILLQRQRDEAARAASTQRQHQDAATTNDDFPPFSRHLHHQRQTTPLRQSAAGASSYVISPVGGASVDFSYPQQMGSLHPQQAAFPQHRSPPHSPQQHATAHRHVGSSRRMDDMDSPPQFQQQPSSPPLNRRVIPLTEPAERHSPAFRESAAKSSSKRQHTTQADIAAVREECQKQIGRLTTAVADGNKLLDEKEDRIQQLADELERHQRTQNEAIRSAVLGVLEEASARIRREGFIGLDRLRQDVANGAPDAPLTFTRSSSGGIGQTEQNQTSQNHGGTHPGETEEERLHRALVQSVRQRYLARLQQ